MIRSLRSLIAPAFAVLALGLATGAQAAFSVTASALNVSTTATDGTTLNFALLPVQASSDNFPTTFNVLNIGEPTASGLAPSANYTVTETLTLAGAGNETVTLTSTFLINPNGTGGKLIGYGGTTFNVTSGGGYTISTPTFAAPGIGSDATNPTSTTVGNLSFTITPAAVPEPASVVLLGLGLVGTVGFAARRRLA